jgi:hypothetical protein
VAHEQQTPAADKYKEAANSAKPIPPSGAVANPSTAAPTANSESRTGQNEAPEKPLPRFERPEWVIVYITAIYSMIAGLSLWVIRRQADTMKQQAADARNSATEAAIMAQDTLNAIERQVIALRRQAIWLKLSARASSLSAKAAVTTSRAALLNAQAVIKTLQKGNPKDELVRAAAEGSQISTNYRANPNTAKYTIVYRATVASIAAPALKPCE